MDSLLRQLRIKCLPEGFKEAFLLLDTVGLSSFANQRADALSAGQRQRVGIARVVMQRPELLLTDEPTSSLDPKTSVEIMELMADIAGERKIPVIVNMHNVELAKRFRQRMIGMAGNQAYDWALEFDQSTGGHLQQGNLDKLQHFLKLGQLAKMAHPTHEHYLPLLYAAGAVDAGEQFYAPDASMQENSQPPRRGQETLIAYERAVIEACSAMRTLPVESFLVDGDFVVIHWVFEFTRNSGKIMRIDELAHQRWEGEKIVEERFFYDPVAALGE